jgi:hypothetical protein
MREGGGYSKPPECEKTLQLKILVEFGRYIATYAAIGGTGVTVLGIGCCD